MIEIINDGPAIVRTNYWETKHAAAGYVYGTWNAGALRLLIPDSMLDQIAEMRTGRLAVVTRGALMGRPDALEVLFDDDSDAPYALHIVREQIDRIVPESDAGSGIVVTVWSRMGKLAEWPGHYRVAAALPYMEPWIEH
ncbi:MAG: hypothetical protein WBG17_00660 [Burkholderiaceae bacterium]